MRLFHAPNEKLACAAVNFNVRAAFQKLLCYFFLVRTNTTAPATAATAAATPTAMRTNGSSVGGVVGGSAVGSVEESVEVSALDEISQKAPGVRSKATFKFHV
jgi:hypothetical protein